MEKVVHVANNDKEYWDETIAKKTVFKNCSPIPHTTVAFPPTLSLWYSVVLLASLEAC